MLYLRLFWEFFKTGLFAVGGGLATLPFLQDMADRTGWFTRAQLADMLAVSESTPGPIGVNMATYVGFTTGGVGGALIATLGLVTPSVIVILIVAAFLKAFRDSKWVRAGGGGRYLRGAHRTGECRRHRSGAAELESHRAGGGAAGVDAVGQIHQKTAPHSVHSGQRRRGRGVRILNREKRMAVSFETAILFSMRTPPAPCASTGLPAALDNTSPLCYNPS